MNIEDDAAAKPRDPYGHLPVIPKRLTYRRLMFRCTHNQHESSPTGAISSNDPCTKSFEPYRSTLGNARAWRPELGSELAKL